MQSKLRYLTITVTDNATNPSDLSSFETFTIAVNKVNVAPELGPIGNRAIDELTNLAFVATASDTDVPVQSLTFSLVGNVPVGAHINSTTGEFSWTPTEAQGPGTFTFDVMVSDGLLTDSETITLMVAEVNAAPVAVADIYIANEDHALTVTAPGVLFNDSDINGDQVIAILQSTVSHGVLSFHSDGSFNYFPNNDWYGTDSFTYAAYDGQALSNFVTVTIAVRSAQSQLESVVNAVEALVANGSLNHGNGNALIVKLESAIDKIDAGKVKPAVNNLNAFIHQVDVFVSTGKLTAAQGQYLVEAVTIAMDSVTFSGSSALLVKSASNEVEAETAEPIRFVDELLTGIVWVSFQDPLSATLPAHRERLDDAIFSLNTTFAAYGLTLGVVPAGDEALANVRIVIADSSDCGSAADSVLGCTSAGEVTLIAGWNWYTGISAIGIEGGQYDFQTILTHELGHAVGLDHSGDEMSVMHNVLSDAIVRRSVTEQDLLLLRQGSNEPESLPSALRASPRQGAQPDLILTTDIATPIISHLLNGDGGRMPFFLNTDDNLVFSQNSVSKLIRSEHSGYSGQPRLEGTANPTVRGNRAAAKRSEPSPDFNRSAEAVDAVFDLDGNWFFDL